MKLIGVSPSMEYAADDGPKGKFAGINPYQLKETPKVGMIRLCERTMICLHTNEVESKY